MNEPQYVALLIAPNGHEIHIGPTPFRHVAEGIAHYFAQPNRHPEGAVSAAVAPYDDRAPSSWLRPLIPRNPDWIAQHMDHPQHGLEAPFPNLFDRLKAQETDGDFVTLWDRALVTYDRINNAPAKDKPSELDQLRERVGQLEATVQRLAASTGCYCPSAPRA